MTVEKWVHWYNRILFRFYRSEEGIQPQLRYLLRNIICLHFLFKNTHMALFLDILIINGLQEMKLRITITTYAMKFAYLSINVRIFVFISTKSNTKMAIIAQKKPKITSII